MTLTGLVTGTVPLCSSARRHWENYVGSPCPRPSLDASVRLSVRHARAPQRAICGGSLMPDSKPASGEDVGVT